MRQYAIHPFAFPTTVAFVDDSRSFLESVALGLNANLAFKLFDSPFSALVELNGCAAMPPMVQDFFSLYRYRGEASDAQHVVNVNLDKIHREVHNDQRFEQISVVVVDFDMPDMNGLEFCRNIKNEAVRKILLTGIADEQVAVQAFNEGIIDRFIRKQYPDAMARLNAAIGELQVSYLQQIEDALLRLLAVGSHMFLFDPIFAQRFGEIRAELKIVEHYLSCVPDGVLMLDMSGIAYLLIVKTEEMMRSHYEIADELAAPADLLRRLSSRRYIPYFWQTGGEYSPEYDDWKSLLYPATEIKGIGDCWYCYAVVKNPAGLNLKSVLSYGDYLDQLDSADRLEKRGA